MAKARQFPNISRLEDIHIGGGWLFLGTANSTYSDTALTEIGALTGAATYRPQFEYADLMSGSPEVLIKREATTIGCEIEVTVVEMSLLKFMKYFGCGTRATAVADPVTSQASETMTMYGTFPHKLQGHDITATSVTVTSNDATPVTRHETDDYVIDYDNGTIRRVSGGAISDGDQVYVTYTYSRQAYESLDVGSVLTTNYFPLKFVVPKTDGYYLTFKMWKAYPQPGEINFESGDWSKLTITFKAAADLTRGADSLLYRIENEAATIYTS